LNDDAYADAVARAARARRAAPDGEVAE